MVSPIYLGSSIINKVYLGSTEIKKVYLGSTVVFDSLGAPPAPVYWEDFEDGTSRMNTSSGTNSWSVGIAGPYEGTYRYNYGGGSNHGRRWDNTVSYNAADTITFEGYVRAVAGGTNLSGLVFGQGTGYNGYSVIIDTRNSTGGSSAFQLRINNSTVPLANDSGITVSSGTWYRIEIIWQTSAPRITANLYNAAGTLLSTLTSNSATYTSGYLGVHSYNTSAFDALTVT